VPQNTVPRPVMLTILDGWGLSDNPQANAVTLGRTPNFDRLWANYPKTQLKAAGENVGLQPGVFGNSEVGHLNIGAGRIVWQDSLIIDRAIDDGSFFENETLLKAMKWAKEHGTKLHLMGLISNGSVHSSETHYFALLKMAAGLGFKGDDVLVHAFTDGRDTPPRSAMTHVGRLLAQMEQTGVGVVASVIGRYFAMDRDNRWEREQAAYECLTEGKGRIAPDTITAIEEAYARGENDEFIEATAIQDANGAVRPRIAEGDAVIFFNYRSDRGRQLAQIFIEADFDKELREESEQPGAHDAEKTPIVTKFRRAVWPKVSFSTMTRYSAHLDCPIAFEPRPQRDGLGETVAKAGKAQLRIAETEKYPHVTYFFSGGIEEPWDFEQRILIPSPKVATYDLQPEMNEPQVTDAVIKGIRSGDFDLIVLNYANPDMVGHTGLLEAAITAVEAVDAGLGRVMDAIEDVGGALLVIADHGNCEQMIDYTTGEPHTAHTTNPVPCILFGKDVAGYKLRDGGRLADVSPTLLDLMDVTQPTAMTGISLLKEIGNREVAGVQSAQVVQAKNAARAGNAALSPREVEAAAKFEI
jgi:2,3-bisphosphoglycerate-independent phosphoglycerate mutase